MRILFVLAAILVPIHTWALNATCVRHAERVIPEFDLKDGWVNEMCKSTPRLDNLEAQSLAAEAESESRVQLIAEFTNFTTEVTTEIRNQAEYLKHWHGRLTNCRRTIIDVVRCSDASLEFQSEAATVARMKSKMAGYAQDIEKYKALWGYEQLQQSITRFRRQLDRLTNSFEAR